MAQPVGAAHAEDGTSSYVSVYDGDQLDILGKRVHLAGIDAPERDQSCRNQKNELYFCGRVAEIALAEKVVNQVVSCRRTRPELEFSNVAICRLGDLDLGGWLVSQGLAVADRQVASAYLTAEQEAIQAKRGVWAGTLTMPWDVRRGVRDRPDGYANRFGPALAALPTQAEAAAQSSDGGHCLIKGNITREGSKLYWVPGSRRYQETVITEATGERWFCNEDEARAAGWRDPDKLPVAALQPAPAPAPVAKPADCLIKGNITREGSKLYWVPGSRRYQETVITEATGERWFCSEDEARAAGWAEPVK